MSSCDGSRIVESCSVIVNKPRAHSNSDCKQNATAAIPRHVSALAARLYVSSCPRHIVFPPSAHCSCISTDVLLCTCRHFSWSFTSSRIPAASLSAHRSPAHPLRSIARSPPLLLLPLRSASSSTEARQAGDGRFAVGVERTKPFLHWTRLVGWKTRGRVETVALATTPLEGKHLKKTTSEKKRKREKEIT